MEFVKNDTGMTVFFRQKEKVRLKQKFPLSAGLSIRNNRIAKYKSHYFIA